MSARLRVLLIGAGAIAPMHVHALGVSNRAELAGVVDVDPQRAAALAAAAGVPSYATLDAVPASLGAEAAIVCTPPAGHEDLALALLGRGLHVMCEKPFTLSSESARRMIAAANSADRIITMASKFRYAADVVRARELVRAGAIGELVLYENTFASFVDMRSRWNAQRAVSGGGVLIDNGTHSFDLARFLLGRIGGVHAYAPRRVQPIEVEDTVHATIRTRDGVIGSIDLSWSLRKEIPSFATLYGAEGTIEIGWRESRMRTGDGEWTTIGTGYDKLAAFSAQLENFAAAIAREEPLVIGCVDALASVHVVEAAYRALRAGRWNAVEDAFETVAAA